MTALRGLQDETVAIAALRSTSRHTNAAISTATELGIFRNYRLTLKRHGLIQTGSFFLGLVSDYRSFVSDLFKDSVS